MIRCFTPMGEVQVSPLLHSTQTGMKIYKRGMYNKREITNIFYIIKIYI